MLSAERDLTLRVVDGETRYLSRTTLSIGSVVIQVFADPWRDDPPELSEDAVLPFIPLVGNQARHVIWPPSRSIDNTRSDDAEPASENDTPAPSASDEVGDEHATRPLANPGPVTDRTPTAPEPEPSHTNGMSGVLYSARASAKPATRPMGDRHENPRAGAGRVADAFTHRGRARDRERRGRVGLLPSGGDAPGRGGRDFRRRRPRPAAVPEPPAEQPAPAPKRRLWRFAAAALAVVVALGIARLRPASTVGCVPSPFRGRELASAGHRARGRGPDQEPAAGRERRRTRLSSTRASPTLAAPREARDDQCRDHPARPRDPRRHERVPPVRRLGAGRRDRRAQLRGRVPDERSARHRGGDGGRFGLRTGVERREPPRRSRSLREER